MSKQSSIHVLLLEDDLAFAELVQELMLSDIEPRWQIVHASHLQEALKYLSQAPFDVVLSDLHLPDSLGVDTVSALQQAAPHLPLVILTGLEEPELGIETLRRGAQDYLNKADVTAPLLERSLRYAIERIRNQALLQQNEQRLAQLVDERTAQLREEVARREALFNASMDGIVLLDRNCAVVEANYNFAHMLGYTLEEVHQLTAADWDITWSREELAAEIQQIKQELRFETRHRRKDGTSFDVEVGVSSLIWQGQLLQVCVCRNISAQKQAEAERQQAIAALQESEVRYRQLFEVNPQPMWVYDLETLRFLAVNDAAIRKYGYSEAEFLAMTIADIRPSEDLPRLLDNVASVTSGIDEAGTWRHRLKDGSLICVDITSHTLEFAGRQAELVLAHDVTEQFNTEQALRSSEQKHRALIAALPDLVMRVHRDGTYLDFLPPKSFKLFRTLDLHGQHLFDGGLPQDLAEQRMHYIQQALATGELQRYEQRVMVEDNLRDEEVRINPLGKDEVIILVRDITDRKQAEAALAQSEATNRAIINAIPDLLIQMDREGCYNRMLAGSAVLVKQPQAAGTSLSLYDILPLEMADQRLYYAHQALASGELQIYEQSLHIDGELRDEEVRIAPLNDQEVLVIIRDISDRKQIERELHQLNQDLEERIDSRTAALRESESRFRSIFEQSPVGIAITNLQGQISRANPSLRQMLGYARDDILQETIQDLLAIDPAEVEGSLFEGLLDRTLPMVAFEKRCVPHKGQPLWVKVIGTCLLDGFGRPAGLLHLIDDITTEKETQAALVEVSSLQQGILNSTDYAIISTDPDGIIQTFNAGAERMLGYTADEVVGKATPELFHDPKEVFAYEASRIAQGKAPPPTAFAALVAEAREGIVSEHSWTYVTKTGERVPIMLSIAALWHQPKTLAGFVGIAKDITQQRLAEQQVQQFQARLQFVMSSSLAITYTCRPTPDTFTCTFISNNVTRLLGYSPATVLNDPTFWIDHLHPEDKEVVLSSLPQLFERDRLSREYRFRHSDGHYCWLQDEPRLVRDEAGQPQEIVGYLADISDRKAAEAEAEEQRQLLQEILDGLPISLFLKEYRDGQVMIRFINRTTREGFNLQNVDLTTVSYGGLFGEASDRFLQNDLLVLESGKPTIEEDYFIHNGQTLHFLLSRTPIYRPNGEHLLLASAVDISDRKGAEERLHHTNEQLAQSNAALQRATRLKDEFLANMSHELRTPLNAILGMTEGLDEGVFGEISDRQRSAITTIERSGKHLLELINDILDLSKVESGKLELQAAPVPVSTLCEASLLFVRQQAHTKGIEIYSEIPPNLPDINVDGRRIQQVLINLLTNAVKFTPEGGNVRLMVQADSSRQRLEMSIIDSGIGITPEDLQKLFKPFVQIDNRLNRHHSGTGLGLALVRRLMELHGGTVSVTSTVGQGSCFTISLPYAPSSPLPGSLPAAVSPSEVHLKTSSAPKQSVVGTEDRQSSSAPPDHQPSQMTSPLVLLAEDNDASAASTMSYLTSRGYRVVRATNGHDVLKLATCELPNLILMDIQMPDLDGIETTRQIRAHPALNQVPIIALTALAMAKDREICLAAGVNEYLTKPVRLKSLVTSIEAFLGST
jgi:PAS domain S-box-containing protein